mmetsp:Transcript_85107/g.170025  ORF Transcript_85107/g.170025 Transcript_85107/m.170025 type:complete len:292 (-) Transcript_85107:533-1408(-)
MRMSDLRERPTMYSLVDCSTYSCSTGAATGAGAGAPAGAAGGGLREMSRPHTYCRSRQDGSSAAAETGRFSASKASAENWSGNSLRTIPVTSDSTSPNGVGERPALTNSPRDDVRLLDSSRSSAPATRSTPSPSSSLSDSACDSSAVCGSRPEMPVPPTDSKGLRAPRDEGRLGGPSHGSRGGRKRLASWNTFSRRAGRTSDHRTRGSSSARSAYFCASGLRKYQVVMASKTSYSSAQTRSSRVSSPRSTCVLRCGKSRSCSTTAMKSSVSSPMQRCMRGSQWTSYARESK